MQAAQNQNTAPLVNLWYGGLVTGVSAVQNVAGTFGAEAGIRLWRTMDVSIEVGRFQDTSTRRRADLARTLAAFIQQTQGQVASSSIKAPTTYMSVNARWVFENTRRLRLYGVFGVGGAKVTLEPHFTVGNTDITGSLAQYGVTLGADLTGHSSHAAITGGMGLLIPIGKWYGDAGYRLTSILTSGQATNVSRLHIGFGARF
jgi:opacity protein-like surface antigen